MVGPLISESTLDALGGKVQYYLAPEAYKVSDDFVIEPVQMLPLKYIQNEFLVYFSKQGGYANPIEGFTLFYRVRP